MQQDDTTLAELREIVTRVARVDPAGITRESKLHGELGIGSLSMIDLVVAAEDRFGVRIPDEDTERFETVGDLVDFLHQAQAA